jgi:dipeptidyl aminopeptidase/acylaminoacyl peptidase
MLGLVGTEIGLEGDGPFQDQSSMVQAVCASAPPTDFSNWFIRGLLAGPEESRGERSAAASPVSYVSPTAPPFLIIHGKADKTVQFEQGKLLAEKLKAAGCDVKLMAYDDAGHGVFRQKEIETGPAMEAFFARVLDHP